MTDIQSITDILVLAAILFAGTVLFFLFALLVVKTVVAIAEKLNLLDFLQ